MDLNGIIKEVVEKQASDVFIVAGRPLSYKVNNSLYDYTDKKLSADDTRELITQIYALANGRDMSYFIAHGDDDFSFSLRGVARFRANIYKQRNSYAAVIRVVAFVLPDPKALSIPENVLMQVDDMKGLVLVTGASGCGKSTTLACMIDRINKSKQVHIVTLEDPIEYLHSHNMSIISQREISLDTDTYITALRAVVRQSPDVILIGELRDDETTQIAMTASETGHLVLSTLHTLGAANTIDRIIDMFPADKEQQVRLQLSMVLQAVITQQLVMTKDGKLKPVFEIMICNSAIRNLIREAKTHQIDSVIQSSAAQGMITMDTALMNLYKGGEIDEETLISHSYNPEAVAKRIAANQ
ncbi:MAG: PilT/PilU family type 4a pilus ATPase [Eubacteriaceae bacterium]|nr:PilT/PilU family type 4a pilus ATPase [Eubacteriaceae bacterium]